MIRVLLIEDEALASIYLEHLLSVVAPDMQVVKKIDNVSTAIEWLSENQPDLMFMDIHLGGDSAFSIFEQHDIKTPVIFTTGYSEYAVKAFRLNSIDYLLKPFSADDLRQAIGKFRSRNAMGGINVSAMLGTLRSQKDFQERFLAVNGKKIKSIPVGQVAYFSAQGRYTQLVTKANEKYLLDHSLENIIGKVDPQLFFRVNRQMIVGFDAITSMMAWSRSRIKIELSPAAEIEVVSSIDNTAEFKRWLDR